MDRLTSLETFVEIVEQGSFTRAAARMKMSPAMASIHIARLEEDLGVQLLHRTTRRVELTDKGHDFLPHARDTVQRYLVAKDAVHSATQLRGYVRIDAPTSFVRLFLLPALPRLAELMPEVVVDVSMGDKSLSFRSENADLLLRIGHEPMQGWSATVLGHTRHLYLASPDYLARHGVPREPADLAQHRCIIYGGGGATDEGIWRFSKGRRKLTMRPRPSLVLNEGHSSVLACAAGLGIALNVAFLAHEELATGALVPVLEDWEPATMPIALMTRSDRMELSYVKAVTAFLTSQINWHLKSPLDGAGPGELADSPRREGALATQL